MVDEGNFITCGNYLAGILKRFVQIAIIADYLAFTGKQVAQVVKIITRLARLRMNVTFSTDVSWNNTVQWDNVSDTVGINSRVRWIIVPGSEFFVVFNQELLADGWDVSRGRTEPVAKFVWTFRF